MNPREAIDLNVDLAEAHRLRFESLSDPCVFCREEEAVDRVSGLCAPCGMDLAHDLEVERSMHEPEPYEPEDMGPGGAL